MKEETRGVVQNQSYLLNRIYRTASFSRSGFPRERGLAQGLRLPAEERPLHSDSTSHPWASWASCNSGLPSPYKGKHLCVPVSQFG